MKFVQRIFPALLIILFGGLVQSIFADHGRSPVIEYVIKQEAQIEAIKADIKILKQACEATTVEYDYTKLVYRTKNGLKAADSKEMLALQQRYQDLQNCIDMTLHDIEMMFDTGAVFNVTDDFGRTALNYCTTKEIYYKLRTCDMPFQYDAWLYVHSYECICTSIFLGLIGLGLYQNVNFA